MCILWCNGDGDALTRRPVDLLNTRLQLGPNPANPPLPTDTRRVFVCFMRSGPIVMQRMLDAHVRTGVDLSNVVIVCIPWKDTISSACSQCVVARRAWCPALGMLWHDGILVSTLDPQGQH